MTLDQKRARVFGVLYLITFVTSIPALLLFQPVLDVPLERATWAAALGLLIAAGSVAAGGARSEPDRSAWPAVRRVDALFLAIAAAALTAALLITARRRAELTVREPVLASPEARS